MAVSLSGATALIGAYSHMVGSNAAQGAAYVFASTGGAWSEQAELTAPDGAATDRFGNAVSLSGTTALVGAFTDQVGSNEAQGAAYVFASTGGAWPEQAELHCPRWRRWRRVRRSVSSPALPP